jgi:hypothetical protein
MCTAPLSANDAFAIGTLCWSKWTTASLLNSAHTHCQSHRRLSAGRSRPAKSQTYRKSRKLSSRFSACGIRAPMRRHPSRHYRLAVVPNPTLPVTKIPKADAVVFSHALGCDQHLKCMSCVIGRRVPIDHLNLRSTATVLPNQVSRIGLSTKSPFADRWSERSSASNRQAQRRREGLDRLTLPCRCGSPVSELQRPWLFGRHRGRSGHPIQPKQVCVVHNNSRGSDKMSSWARIILPRIRNSSEGGD